MSCVVFVFVFGFVILLVCLAPPKSKRKCRGKERKIGEIKRKELRKDKEEKKKKEEEKKKERGGEKEIR